MRSESRRVFGERDGEIGSDDPVIEVWRSGEGGYYALAAQRSLPVA